MFLYKNCRLIDGTGADVIEPAAVLTRGERIVYAGPVENLPVKLEEVQCLDMQGRTILPGLFNCHVHLALRFPFNSYCVDEYRHPGYRTMVMYRRAIEALFCGVTTLRCTGESDLTDLAVRDAINKGMLMGPRVLAAGPIIIAHGGHGAGQWGSVECTGPTEFAKQVRQYISCGVDLIKICATGGMVGEHENADTMQMTEEEIKAVCTVAGNYGKTVAGHIGNDYAIRTAVKYGVKSIEHGYIMNRETADIMAQAGAFLVPTLSVSAACEYLEAHKNPSHYVEKIRKIGKTHLQSAHNAIAAGVRIAVGTDLLPSDPMDGTNATTREVELLVQAGLTCMDAIKAATSASAELCGVSRVTGSLLAGLDADLIAVSGKPDKDIRDLRNLDMVVKGGSLVFSSIPGDMRPGFSPLPFNEHPKGASFINW